MQQYIWYNGKFVKFEDAKVHVLTHSLQYGSGIFEGIREYSTSKGSAVFRLDEHVKRFFNSAEIYGIRLGFSQAGIRKAIVETLRKNKLAEAYIRPFAFYDDARIGLGTASKKISVIIAAVPFGSYFDNKDKGIKCKVSSWHRMNSLIMPPEAKSSGNYANSIIASLEARNAGADEAIMLSANGYVAEGPGENIFLVEDGKLITPSRSADILMGITRSTIIRLAESIGIEVEEREVHREELYTCDEAFFAGTAAEITPIISVDSVKKGGGRPGAMTLALSDAYSSTVHGKKIEFDSWLTYV